LLRRGVPGEKRANDGTARTRVQRGDAPGVYAEIMAGYVAKVAAGFWKRTDTLSKLLGRAPRAYAHWLEQNLPGSRSLQADPT
jgi:hypothetical protein